MQSDHSAFKFMREPSLLLSIRRDTMCFCVLHMMLMPNFGHLILDREYQISGE